MMAPDRLHIILSKVRQYWTQLFLLNSSEALVPDYPGYKVGCKHAPKEEHDFAMLVLEVRRDDWQSKLYIIFIDI